MLEESLFRIIMAFLIIFLGFLISNTGSKITTAIHRKRKGTVLKRTRAVRLFTTAVMLVAILSSLFILQIDVSGIFFITLYNLLPDIISAILLLAVVIIIVNIFVAVIEKFLSKSGFMDFVKEYEKMMILSLMLWALRIILYVSLSLVALSLIGVDIMGLSSALGLFFYPFLVTFLIMIFWGTRDLIENYFAGMHLRYSGIVKVGEIIRIDEGIYTVKRLSSQGVTAESDCGASVFIPNKRFLKEETYLKSSSIDLMTLEEIKSHFVAQEPSYCGPASVSMILSIFGHNVSQQRIGKDAGAKVGFGTLPNRLILSAERFTDRDVTGKWISSEKILDLKQEITSWLSDGALIIIDYKKAYLFPEATTGHYSVCIAVEGDELVIIDPNAKVGGVFLANYRRVQAGMDTYSSTIKGKRGYIVLAKKGTAAYQRIKEGLVYSDINLYHRMDKSLKQRFNKMMSRSEALDFAFPDKVKDYLRKYKEKHKISRVWKPEDAV